ncbi:protein NO VEIN domain-containing protein [Streptomyces antimycoticus]|uniref:protein NO VEIN domain-containing protein n=1 Tax=Streptomyces antimycoticus TaxID=68175 RepID=UPI001D15535D
MCPRASQAPSNKARRWYLESLRLALCAPVSSTALGAPLQGRRRDPLHSAEVREATQSAATITNRRSARKGGLTAAERGAIEKRSVLLATEHFKAQGWTLKDVGATKSYDLELKRGDEKLHVEVKGTTSDGSQIILTRAEVEWQRKFAPDNALVIVHSIKLDRTVKPATATGGVLQCTSPWTIEDETLTVISYIQRTGL